VVAESGYKGFYRGYLTTVMREIPFACIQFPLYEGMKDAWRKAQSGRLDSWQAAACGSLAGGFAACVTTPIDVTKTRLMLGKDKDGVPYKGMVNTMKRIHAEGGIPMLFSGVYPRTFWITLGGYVFFGAYEVAKRNLEGGAQAESEH